MNNIIEGISYVLGLLMDLYFRGLTFIGYPRLWACIILFAVTTRLLFLPQRISNQRSKLLAPVVRRDLLQADPKFFEKTKDKELTIQKAALKKQISKKYKISNGSGCLTTLIQYPILVALFYVVKHPEEFVPSLEKFSSASSQVNSFLGVKLSAVPLDSMIQASSISLIIFVPLLVMTSTFFKMFPSLKMAKTISDKIKVYSLCLVFTVLIGWLSAKLPLVISLYWITNDCTYMVMDFFIKKFLPKSKTISSILEEYKNESQNSTSEAQSPEAIGENTIGSDVNENVLENDSVVWDEKKGECVLETNTAKRSK